MNYSSETINKLYYGNRLINISVTNGGGGGDVPSNLSEWAYDDNGMVKSITYTAETIPVSAYSFSKLTDATIKSSVTSIGNGAFISSGQMSGLTIENGVISIGDVAFRYCTSLTSIDIPNSVTSIGIGAFANCNGLTSVTIQSGITSISNQVFQFCNSLTRITIPNSVTSIGNNAFQGCSGLTSMVIPDTVTSVGNALFIDCGNLTACTIGSGITNALSNDTFKSCNKLSHVEINVNLPERFLQVATNLTEVVVGSNVTSIGRYNFYGRAKLTSVTILATTPPALAANNEFYNTNNCPIYVPAASVDAYKSATNWSNYADRIQAIS